MASTEALVLRLVTADIPNEYLTSHPGQLTLAIISSQFAEMSSGSGHTHCHGRNGLFYDALQPVR